MPELPEVETLRQSLLPHLVGRSITHVTVNDPRLRRRVDAGALAKAVIGRRVLAIDRRAKYLYIRLDGAEGLLLHLGMSGTLVLVEAKATLEAHTHVVLRLDDGRELRFRDPRRFGMLQAVHAEAMPNDPLIRVLGVEPLSPAFNAAWLHERSRGSRRPIKNFLMDAHVVVGIGNIYASESLHVARIHPLRAAGRLSMATCDRLIVAVQDVLAEALRQGGTTLNDFMDADGRSGYFQVSLRVYGRAGEPCSRCGAKVMRRVLAGRSTFYCPKCQR